MNLLTRAGVKSHLLNTISAAVAIVSCHASIEARITLLILLLTISIDRSDGILDICLLVVK